MEAVIVGDLHGNRTFYKKIKRLAKEKIILVGDLVDSRTFSRAEQLGLLEEVLDDIEDGITDCIFGNHELSYLIPSMRSSGYEPFFDAMIMPLQSKMWKLMKPFIFDSDNGILISHAGLSETIIHLAHEEDGFPFNEFEDYKTFLELSWKQYYHDSYVYYIGQTRGGYDPCGGIFWCDWNKEFKPIPKLTQIFGHTPVITIETRRNNWNLDCVEYGKSELVVKLKDSHMEIVNYAQTQSEAPGRSEGPSRAGEQANPTGTTETT